MVTLNESNQSSDSNQSQYKRKSYSHLFHDSKTTESTAKSSLLTNSDNDSDSRDSDVDNFHTRKK